jgi:hypothetical protein
MNYSEHIFAALAGPLVAKICFPHSSSFETHLVHPATQQFPQFIATISCSTALSLQLLNFIITNTFLLCIILMAYLNQHSISG